jgi:ribosomal protein S18 acetylase RimI-like enzyme
VRIRHAEPSDHARVAAVIDEWWGGRQVRDMLPRLFFTHFRDTSFVAEEDGELAGFLCGFLSQTYLDQAYCHFIGVAPEHRTSGLASELYERLFDSARAAGRTSVHCVTSPKNTGSIAFHTRIGFEIEAEVDGYDGSGESRVLLAKSL